jgi:hypothetical protein
MDAPQFSLSDLVALPPTPGCYAATISAAGLRRSARGHRMVAVTFTLAGARPGRDRVVEYFVLEGASPRGLQIARWRLVALCRACGLQPRDGEEIRPGALLGARVTVTLELEERAGRTWARVAAYQPQPAPAPDDDVPF